MDTTKQIDELFLQRMKTMRKQELTNMLCCIICQGLFRFAHTIVDCGHTFCQVCIFKYIRGFKGRNPSIKCPQCHLPVDSNYKRSIIHDIFKQSLVDSLAPQYSTQDKQILKRLQQLFPQYQLQYIFEQFKFATFQIPMQMSMPMKMYKKQNDVNMNMMMGRLPEKIKEKFNMIVDEDGWKGLLEVGKSGRKGGSGVEGVVVTIRPKSQRDFSYIGINNQMKAANLNVTKLQRYIQKKTLQRINITQKVPIEWISSSDQKLDIKIYLQINGYQIEPTDDLQQILGKNKGYPILYSLSKPGLIGNVEN